MANKKTIIIVLFIIFSVAMMEKQPLKRERNDQTCPVTDAINKHKGEVKKEQERVKKLLDEVARQIEVSCGSACQVGWIRHGESCYYMDDTPTRKQADARATCQSMGGDIPIIRSAEENNFVANLLPKTERARVAGLWIGLERNTADSKLYWIDGTPLDGQYSKWRPGQPNNYLSHQNCVHAHGPSARKWPGTGKWNDIYCTSAYNGFKYGPFVVCQKPVYFY